jgi:hypothetical protein
MDKVVTAAAPRIAKGSEVYSPILSVKEFGTHLTKLRSYGSWVRGAMGHYTLKLFLDDGLSGPQRECMVQFKGSSKFGLGFFTAKDGSQEKEEEEENDSKKKPKKKRVKPAGIAFSHESGSVQEFDAMLNAAVKYLFKENKKQLLDQICPGRTATPPIIQRRASRESSGSTCKNMRIICYPGRVELRTLDGSRKSMQSYLAMAGEGDYTAVVSVAAIDASYEKEVISYGPVLYGVIVAMAKEIPRVPLELRDEPEASTEAGESGESWEPAKESDYDKVLEAAAKLKKKEQKEKETEQKSKNKKKRKTED